MNLRQKLLVVADAYSQAAGIGRKRVSTIVLNGGAKLDAIANGADLTTGTYEKAMAWFADNWPEGADWPAAIACPDKFEGFPQDGAVPRGASAPAGPVGIASGPAFSSLPSRANVGEGQVGAVVACSADPASRGAEVLIASSPRMPGFSGEDDGRDAQATGGAASVVNLSPDASDRGACFEARQSRAPQHEDRGGRVTSVREASAS